MIRYPRPESTAIISAATSTSQATPNAIRRPTTILGRMAGKITLTISAPVDRPKFRPACTYIGGTLRTPFIVATTIGKNDATKIRKIGARLVTPNQCTARGIEASDEIGRSIWISGFVARGSALHQPRPIHAGAPRTAAAE